MVQCSNNHGASVTQVIRMVISLTFHSILDFSDSSYNMIPLRLLDGNKMPTINFETVVLQLSTFVFCVHTIPFL